MTNKSPLANPQFFLEKPRLANINYAHMKAVLEDPHEYKNIIRNANQPKYIYWDKFKHRSLSEKITIEEQWFLTRFYRDITAVDTPIKSKTGKYFRWVHLPSVDEKLHDIDMLMGGQIFPKSSLPSVGKEVFINRGVIEEAIASSQLEGAHTTRAAAKKLILEKRKPQNESEQMILNNYKAMLALEDDFKEKKLSKSFLFELHSMLTYKTVGKSERKRFRKDSDQIVVEGDIGANKYTAYVPPDEKFLETEIERLISYANDDLEEGFVHPIVKAIFLHFWIGYLHPFTDGNGRLARSLFYWYLLRHGYWAFSYLPISTIIRKSPTQYAMAYIYTEQDSEDLTYFFDYQMRKISQSIREFNEYCQKQFAQNKIVNKMLSEKLKMNDRQKQLLLYFISDNNASTTITAHSTLNTISRQTAAKDLQYLEDNHFIKPHREGKFVRYYADKDLQKSIRSKV